jgi:hypothetical protein
VALAGVAEWLGVGGAIVRVASSRMLVDNRRFLRTPKDVSAADAELTRQPCSPISLVDVARRDFCSRVLNLARWCPGSFDFELFGRSEAFSCRGAGAMR